MDLVLRCLTCATLLISSIIICRAQDDDLDGPWMTPTLDALDRFREDPLCLRCATPSTLTQLPGISRRLAARIAAASSSPSITTIQELADSVCASPDQFIILTSCATLTCSCFTLIHALRVRSRMRSAPEPHVMSRIDASFAYGTAGATVLVNEQRLEPSAWLIASYGGFDVSVGDLAFQSGTGLLLGTARTLIRRGIDVLPSSTPLLGTRPWPSTAFDNAPRGAALQWKSPWLPITLATATWFDRTSIEPHACTSLHIGINVHNVEIHASYVRDAHPIRPRDAMSLATSYDHEHVRIVSELRIRSDALEGMHAAAGYYGRRSDLVGVVWHYAPHIELDVGVSALGSSQPTNQRGVHLAAQYRPTSQFSGTASITLSERITRSYLDPLPSSSMLLRCDIEYRPQRSMLLRLQASHQLGYESVASSDGRIMTQRGTARARIEYEVRVSPSTLFRARIDVASASTPDTESELGSMLAVMCRTSITPSITVTVQFVQWRSSSFDVASRIRALGVPGTFDMLVTTGTGRAMHAQVQATLPLGCSIVAHVRHEVRATTSTTVWTLQAAWSLSRTDK